MSRRIEIRPVGTNGDPAARAVLFDVDGAELCEIPATYVKPPDSETPRYVVLDLAPDTPPLWGATMSVRKGASADALPASANALPFEQRSAIWTLYYASQEARRRTLAQRAERPNAPGSNAEMGFALVDLDATNARAMSLHRLSKAGLRRGLDALVDADLAVHNIGVRRRHTWRLTSRGRELVGEPRT